MSRAQKRGTMALGAFAVVVALSLSAMLIISSPATADGGGQPAAKATAKVANIMLIETTQGPVEWTTLLSNTIHTPSQKDLFIDVSLECGLYTDTLARSKGRTKDTSTAQATISVRVLVDGDEANPAYPGEVVFADRMQELSATLEGAIADCLDIGTDGGIVLDEDCVEPEEIELILDTMSANSFNFVANDLDAGPHTVAVQAMIETSADFDEGGAQAMATIGKGSVTVQLVRMIQDEDIILEE